MTPVPSQSGVVPLVIESEKIVSFIIGKTRQEDVTHRVEFLVKLPILIGCDPNQTTVVIVPAFSSKLRICINVAPNLTTGSDERIVFNVFRSCYLNVQTDIIILIFKDNYVLVFSIDLIRPPNLQPTRHVSTRVEN